MLSIPATVALLTLATSAECAIENHEVLSLPGWNDAFPSRQWSGFLAAGSKKKYHYWLVESESEDPTNDPVVLWVQARVVLASLSCARRLALTRRRHARSLSAGRAG